MKESHGEGVATHTGPESCGALSNKGTEALTRETAGRVAQAKQFPSEILSRVAHPSFCC